MPLTGGGIRLHAVGARDVYMPFVTRIGERTGFVFVRHGPEGARDTLSGDLGALGGTPAPNDLAERAQEGLVRCTHSAGRGISFYTADLAPDAFLVPAPDGLRVLAWGGQYRITLIDAIGDTMRVIERDLPGRPLSDAEWAEEQRMYQEFLDGFEDESCEPRTLPRPPERRIILAAYFDDMGRMWVERDAGDHPVFDVFDASGALLATLDAPTRMDLIAPYVRDDRLYLVVRDSLDVEYVKVFDIRREGPG
jgi:hypothetical protein